MEELKTKDERCINWPCAKDAGHPGPCSSGCACVSDDAYRCIQIRYGLDPDDDDYYDEACTCGCHDTRDEDRDEYL